MVRDLEDKLAFRRPFEDYACSACDFDFEDGRGSSTLNITPVRSAVADAADVSWHRY